MRIIFKDTVAYDTLEVRPEMGFPVFNAQYPGQAAHSVPLGRAYCLGAEDRQGPRDPERYLTPRRKTLDAGIAPEGEPAL